LIRALCGRALEPRHATLLTFRDAQNGIIDTGLALYFPAPHSYTGEDVLELQVHGGPVVLHLLLGRLLALGRAIGLRAAEPGEFTQRAFLNGKLDLAQAEAIGDLIDAGSREAARAAMRSLRGEFSAMVHGLTEAVIDVRTYVEAAIDFPEEEIDFLADRQLHERFRTLTDHFEAIERSARQGALLRDGMTVVLAGRPNAGKSSLLNRLAGYDAAIVTPIPGTTRDIVRERIDIDGMPLHVLDTAGLRDGADEVEAEGIRRAHEQMRRADRVLFVIDLLNDPHAAAFTAERDRLPPDVPVTLVLNKSDRAAGIPLADTVAGPPRVAISALTGEGIERLRAHLKECVGFTSIDTGTVSARRRHLDALTRARGMVAEAERRLRERRSGELLAEDLRAAQQALSEITGEFTSEDLLGRIFGSFCIGK
jgi:tRNA modification GTPase